jgi:hypothetical protein
LIAGCSDVNNSEQVIDEQAVTDTLNAELAKVMECYKDALVNNDSGAVKKLLGVLEDFDATYGTELAADFQLFIDENQASTRLTEPITNYPPLTNLPIYRDGDVYLSGGANSLAGYLVDWVSPNVTAANYNHGAVLDLNKFDPTNLDSSCFQTAIEKGAGYETPMQWMTKQNVGVMKSVTPLNSSALNSSQGVLDYYCNPNNTNMKYGFFENTVNFFSLVSKSDNYYWYCTKVIWRVYNALGIDVDSNTSLIDWTSSGLYSIVKAYYNVIYFWSRSRATRALNAYIDNARSTIVLAEEIYYSPQLSLYYQVIR